MPKIKAHKATAKRLKVTGSDKLRRRKGHASHRDTLRTQLMKGG